MNISRAFIAGMLENTTVTFNTSTKVKNLQNSPLPMILLLEPNSQFALGQLLLVIMYTLKNSIINWPQVIAPSAAFRWWKWRGYAMQSMPVIDGRLIVCQCWTIECHSWGNIFPLMAINTMKASSHKLNEEILLSSSYLHSSSSKNQHLKWILGPHDLQHLFRKAC